MFLTSPDYLSCTGLVWVSQGNLLTICSCTDRAIHNTRRLTAVCKHAKSPGSFVNISRVIIKCIRTFESRELESAACWCTFGRRFRGTHDYSLFFIYLFILFLPIDSQMANLQKLNASIICKKMNKIALQVQNKTDVLLFLVCFSYTVPVFAKCTQYGVSIWITVRVLAYFVSIFRCSSDNSFVHFIFSTNYLILK